MFGVDGTKIYYALGALKNVGIEAMQRIQDERDMNGKYKDIGDFARRIDLKNLAKDLWRL